MVELVGQIGVGKGWAETQAWLEPVEWLGMQGWAVTRQKKAKERSERESAGNDLERGRIDGERSGKKGLQVAKGERQRGANDVEMVGVQKQAGNLSTLEEATTRVPSIHSDNARHRSCVSMYDQRWAARLALSRLRTAISNEEACAGRAVPWFVAWPAAARVDSSSNLHAPTCLFEARRLRFELLVYRPVEAGVAA